ncbi:MAG: hypothetical protein PHO79_02230 [Desulfoplanes sp.]|nr:hypothetical protein [Desulfoplanes sp.]
MDIAQFQAAITDLSEVSSAMNHLKDLYWSRDSNSCETAMISLFADRLKATTEKFYNLEDELVSGLHNRPARTEETKKAQ